MLAQDDPSWGMALAMVVIIGLVLIASGALSVALAARAADGRFGRNGLAGIRTRTTRASDEAWLAAQVAGERSTRIGGWLMGAAGVVPALGAAVVWAVADNGAGGFLLVWGVLLMIMIMVALVPFVLGVVQGQRAAKAVVAEANGSPPTT
ncbi:MAG: SdpI family protein [Actinomycetota bacterium]